MEYKNNLTCCLARLVDNAGHRGTARSSPFYSLGSGRGMEDKLSLALFFALFFISSTLRDNAAQGRLARRWASEFHTASAVWNHTWENRMPHWQASRAR